MRVLHYKGTGPLAGVHTKAYNLSKTWHTTLVYEMEHLGQKLFRNGRFTVQYLSVSLI
jgi:hypothetical protein